jgi:membrane protein
VCFRRLSGLTVLPTPLPTMKMASGMLQRTFRIYLKAAIGLVRTAVAGCMTDNIARMSAALAYYTVFSLAPLMIISIAIAGLVFGNEAAQGAIVYQIQGLIGSDAAHGVQAILSSARKPSSGILAQVIGVLVLVLGATGAFSEVYGALNNIWRTPPERLSGAWSIVRARLLSFGLVLVVGFLMLVSLILSAGLTAFTKFAGNLLPLPAIVFQTAELLFTTAILTALFAMIFRILPEARIDWADVWMGALTTAILFSAGKFLISLYIGKSLPASAYGAAGSIVVLIAWIYYSALILYFGAEFTRAYAREYGSHRPTEEKMEPIVVPPARARAQHA